MKKKISAWKILTIMFAILFIASLATSGFKSIGGLSKESAKQTANDFIQTNLVSPDVSIDIEDITEKNGLYVLDIAVTAQGTTQNVESYITKDGKLFFPQALEITTFENPLTQQPTTPTTTDIPKTEKPEVELFVMSFCPYGNKAEDTMLPVYNLLKDKVEWNIHYIVNIQGDNVNSLHGQPEVDQNEREACVLEEYGLDEWFAFATYVNENCGSNGNCWEDAAEEAGLDTSTIETCVSERGFDLMQLEADATSFTGATGSPTLFINGVKSSAVYQYGSSESYKEAICSAFEEAPEECEGDLESTTTSNGGSC